MPDRKDERILGGETSLTPSSDAYITSQIKAIRQGIEGSTGEIVDVTGEVYPPKIIPGTSSTSPLPNTDVIDITPRLTHGDSAFAHRQVEKRRLQKTQKAAA